MSVSRDDVRRIAALARLGVPDARLDALVRELNGILVHMDVLQRLDTAGAAEAAESARASMTLRPDVEGSVPLAHPREQMAPAMRDGFFLVPRLATHEDAAGDE